MASFIFNSVVLGEGTMLVFGSCISIINGHGGFNDHLANPGDLETSAASSRREINKFVDNLGEI